MNFKQTVKKLLPLALPIMFIQIISTASGFFCMMMLAQLGNATLAASALIFSTQMSVMVIGMSILFALSVLIGHAAGAKNYLQIGSLVQQGWTLGFLISIPIIILFLNMGKILILLGQAPLLSTLVQQFFHGYIWGVIPTFLLVCNQQFCFGVNKQKLVAFTGLCSVVILIATAYLLIFGKFGMPSLGVTGLGYAMSIQMWFNFLILMLVFYHNQDFKCFNLFSYRVHQNWDHLLKIFKIGWPISLQLGGELLSFFTASIMVGWLGVTALAASQIVTQYNILIVIPIFSLAQAVGILIGQACGGKQFNQIKNFGYAGISLALLLTVLVAIVLVLFPKTLASFYIDPNHPGNIGVLRLVIMLFAIIAITQIFDAIRNVLVGALRGLLDTRFPMYASLIVIWLIGMPLGYILAFPLHFGVMGIFIGSGIGLAIGAGIMLYRWHVLTKKYEPIEHKTLQGQKTPAVLKVKTNSVIIPVEMGDAIWQPDTVPGNCITIKASPWNVASAQHTVFLQELPKGDKVSEHAHTNDTEIFICLEGTGIITLNGQEHSFKAGDIAYIAPSDKHGIRGTSEKPLRFFVVVSPPGLEERLKLMGIPRKNTDEDPPQSFESPIGKQNTHGVVR